VDGDTVSIGRLGAPKGVRGDLKVHSHSGESAHFRKLKEVELRAGGAESGSSRSLRLSIARVDGDGPSLTIAFEGYTTPETARVLTGLEIIVPRAAASPLRPNEWYEDDLVGLDIVAAGRKLAKVRSVLGGGAEPWLETVIPGAGSGLAERTAILPFRKEFVGEVDIVGGTIELLVPELLDP
jgi:16S rRNA processing protein RimM